MVIETCMWTLEKFHLCINMNMVFPSPYLGILRPNFVLLFVTLCWRWLEIKKWSDWAFGELPPLVHWLGSIGSSTGGQGKTCTLSCKRDTCILITLHVKNILSQNSPFCSVKSSKLLVVLILCPCFHFRPRVGGTQMCGCTIEFWRRGCFLPPHSHGSALVNSSLMVSIGTACSQGWL